MRKTLLMLLAATAVSVSNFAQAEDYVTNYQEIVKAANWDKMKTVTIELQEFEYIGNLEFEQGQPYKLEIKNTSTDDKKHYFTAPEFFKNIATRKAQVNGQAEIKTHYFTAIEVLPKGQLDLYFVAQNKGEYPVYCTVKDHREEGMEDMIIIK